MRIRNWIDLINLIDKNSIEIVGFDLRGTLIKTPRKGNLVRAASFLPIPQRVLVEADKIVPKIVLEKFEYESSVIDWTLVTVLEFDRYLKGKNISIQTIDIERIFNSLIKEYINFSSSLIADLELRFLLSSLKERGIRSFIFLDGKLTREVEVLKKLFPTAFPLFEGIVSSDLLECNKVSSDYYRKAAHYINCSEEKIIVIGDRLDKDVMPAIDAGCTGILVDKKGKNSPFYVSSVKELLPPIEYLEVFPVGVVLGRFQPFHLEHLRYVQHAEKFCKKLLIGITNPYPSLCSESGEIRTQAENNPYPYNLRAAMIDSVIVNQVSVPYSIIPLPLTQRHLKETLPLDSVIFTTCVEQWSLEKESIIRKCGFRILRLEVGKKTISGTKIRESIRNGNDTWKNFLPKLLLDGYEKELVNYLVREN